MSSVPAVLEWLVAHHPTTVGGDTWNVSDGWPASETSRDVIIGGAIDPVIGQNSRLAFIGAETRFEDYTISVEWHAATGDTAQKAVRDAVYAAKAALEAVIRADRTLGGIVDGCAAEINADALRQTDEQAAPNGRFAVLTSQIHVRNSY